MIRNQVTMVGLLGNDAEFTTFENGSKVARFSIALLSSDKSNKNKVNLQRMFAWGNTAEFLNQYCKKGHKLAISGRLVYRTFLSTTGLPQKITEVEVREVVKF